MAVGRRSSDAGGVEGGKWGGKQTRRHGALRPARENHVCARRTTTTATFKLESHVEVGTSLDWSTRPPCRLRRPGPRPRRAASGPRRARRGLPPRTARPSRHSRSWRRRHRLPLESSILRRKSAHRPAASPPQCETDNAVPEPVSDWRTGIRYTYGCSDDAQRNPATTSPSAFATYFGTQTTFWYWKPRSSFGISIGA